jgi:hypothetical protein
MTMPRPRARQSKLPPEAASRKLVGNPKEGNQYGTDAQLDALRESLKVQMRSRKVPQTKVNTILTQIKQRFGDKELERAIREFNASFKGVPRDANISKNPRHG